MLVSELIEKLKELPADAQVMAGGRSLKKVEQVGMMGIGTAGIVCISTNKPPRARGKRG